MLRRLLDQIWEEFHDDPGFGAFMLVFVGIFGVFGVVVFGMIVVATKGILLVVVAVLGGVWYLAYRWLVR